MLKEVYGEEVTKGIYRQVLNLIETNNKGNSNFLNLIYRMIIVLFDIKKLQ